MLYTTEDKLIGSSLIIEIRFFQTIECEQLFKKLIGYINDFYIYDKLLIREHTNNHRLQLIFCFNVYRLIQACIYVCITEGRFCVYSVNQIVSF